MTKDNWFHLPVLCFCLFLKNETKYLLVEFHSNDSWFLTHSAECKFSDFTQVTHPFMHGLSVTPYHLCHPYIWVTGDWLTVCKHLAPSKTPGGGQFCCLFTVEGIMHQLTRGHFQHTFFFSSNAISHFKMMRKCFTKQEFAVWLKKLKQGLCINLEGWDGEGGSKGRGYM